MFCFQNLGKVWTEKKNVPEQRHQTHTNQQQSSSIHHNTRGIRPVHPTTRVTPDKNWTNGGCSRAVNEKKSKKKNWEETVSWTFCSEFRFTSSRGWITVVRCETEKYKNSFTPAVIAQLNSYTLYGNSSKRIIFFKLFGWIFFYFTNSSVVLLLVLISTE